MNNLDITMTKKAVLIGATGLVGQLLLQQLLQVYSEIHVISRRTPDICTPETVTNSDAIKLHLLNDFNYLADTMETIKLDIQTDAFSCLGTTKKQAGSKAAFRHIDYDFNLTFAKCCLSQGIKRFFLLSALGANANSPFFYNKIKGELENAVIALGFVQLYIFQPSLLIGKHQNRPLETLSQQLFKLSAPLLSENLAAHPILANRVASAIKMTATDDCQTKQSPLIITNKQMLAMTKKCR